MVFIYSFPFGRYRRKGVINTRKLITGGIIAGFALLMSVTTSFAAVSISGNGTGSHNSVWANSFTLGSKIQTNVLTLTDTLKLGSKWSKGNSANFNTGGSVAVGNGSTKDLASVNNVANSNSSTGNEACCCNSTFPSVTISGNGDHSQNSVWATTKCITKLDQTNMANIANSVQVGSGTGGNEASHNTNSDVTVVSGDSSANVTVNNMVNSNTSN